MFNKLKAKPDHLAKLLAVLKIEEGFTRTELYKLTDLTQTQTLCALHELIAQGVAKEDLPTKRIFATGKKKRIL